MGQVTFKLEANEAKAVQAFMRVVDAQNKADRGNKKVTQSGRETQSAMSGAGDVGAQKILSLIGPLVSVGASLALLRSSFQAWQKEMEEIGKTATAFSTSLVQKVTDAGDIEHYEKIRKFIETETTGGLTMEKASQVYTEVRGALPNAPFEKVWPVVTKAMESKLTGTDPGQFGTMMGEFAKMFADKSLDDLADMAKATIEMTGRHGQKFGKAGIKVIEQFTAAGLGTAEEGVAFALASFEAGQGAEGALGIVQKLREQRKMPPRNPFGKKESAEQQRLRAYYSADSKERMELLRGSPEMREEIFGTQAAVFEAMMARDPEAIRKSLIEAQEENLFEKSKQLAAADPKTKIIQDTERIKAGTERFKEREIGMEALEDIQVQELIEKVGLRQGEGPFARGFNKWVYRAARGLGFGPERAWPMWKVGSTDDNEALPGITLEEAKLQEIPGYGPLEEQSNTAETEQNTEATKANTEAMQRFSGQLDLFFVSDIFRSLLTLPGRGGQLNPNAQTE